MIGIALNNVYSKFKLNFYQQLFKTFETREASLTTIESFFVEVIYMLDSPTVNEVAKFTGFSQPNIAYKISNLEKKGYITRVRSKYDKREIHLSVTEKFHQYYGINYDYIQLVSRRIADAFPKEDVDKLDKILQTVSRELMPEVTNKLLREPNDGPIKKL